MKLYLVRHGQTDANKEHVMQGQSINLQLNQEGIMQVTSLKNKIQDVKFDLCLTSPLIRAWSTAMILAGDKVLIESDDRLIERSFGELEGKPFEQHYKTKYWDYTLNSNDNNVEQIQELFKRCSSFLEDIKSKYSDKENILIVSHYGVIKCLHHVIEKTKLEGELPDVSIGNSDIREYKI